MTDLTFVQWLSSQSTEQIALLCAPMLLLDGVRYTIGTALIWLCDLWEEFWRVCWGRPDESLTHLPQCCAVVAGLNEADSLGQTLDSLAGAYPNLEIVVVDDGSDDGMSEVASAFAKHHPMTTVVRKPERGGKSSALNAALPYTDAEILVCVDSDSHLGESAIYEIVQPFTDPRVAAVSGTVLVRKPFINWLTWIQALEYYRCIFLGRMFTSRLGILGIVSGAFGAYRRTAVLQVGAWDVGPGEDGDLSMRLRRAGYRVVFAPYAQCFTNPVQQAGRLTKQRRRWEWAVVTLECRKHFEMLNPLSADFNLVNFAMIVDRIVYSIVLQYAFVAYIVWQCFHLNPFSHYQYFFYYLCYLVMEIFQIGILLYYCTDRTHVLKVGLIFPLMPFYYLWMRVVTVWAISEEFFSRRSYRDNFVPERVRRVTWHW